MSRTVEVYWSHNSPYCYLALDRILDLARRPDIEMKLRLVLPGLMRNAGRFHDAPPVEQAYMLLDVERTASFVGMPFGWPRPWPVAFADGNLYRAVPDQPRAWRLYELNAAAEDEGRGWDFVDAVARLIWDGATENWHEGDHLATAIRRAGLDFARLEHIADERRGAHRRGFADNHERLLAAGHWGVPVFVLAGEPFYGQDRFDQLLWRLAQ